MILGILFAGAAGNGSIAAPQTSSTSGGFQLALLAATAAAPSSQLNACRVRLLVLAMLCHTRVPVDRV